VHMRGLSLLPWIISLLAAVSLFSCTTAAQFFRQPEEPVSLTVIQTAEFRGRLAAAEGEEPDAAVSQAASLIKELRAQQDHLLLFDLGNMTGGSSEGYYSSHIDTASRHIQSEILRYLQYQAVVLGSRELGSGTAVYQRIRRESAVPRLGVNIRRQETGEPHTGTYQVFERDTLRIGVFGLTHPDALRGIPQRMNAGMVIGEMLPYAQEAARELKEFEHADVVIALVHGADDLSFRHPSGTQEKAEQEAYREEIEHIARETEGIDVIFTNMPAGDMQTAVPGADGRDVHIIGTGREQGAAGRLDITFRKASNTDSPEIISFIPSIQDYSTMEEDEGFLQRIAPYRERTDAFLAEQIGELEVHLSSQEALFGHTALMEMVHRMQLSVTNAHVSFASPPGLDVHIEQGSLNRSVFFELFPGESYLYSLRMTGEEIRDYLEYSYAQWYRTMRGPYDHLVRFSQEGTADVQIPYESFDSARGIEYTVDITKPPGSRVEITGFTNGRNFRLQETYIAVMNSYRTAGGGGHLSEGAGISGETVDERVVSAASRDFRHHLVRWFSQQGGFSPAGEANWKVIPESWAAAGRLNDYPVIFDQYPGGR